MSHRVLDILVLEPYAAGSHLKWLEGIKKYSAHQITTLTLPGVHWKWRMHGAAITFAEQYKQLNKHFDIILCSDMMDVSVFKALIQPTLTKIGVYFHENQLTYPWSHSDPDIALQRNIQYGYINYTSALAADFVWFNSQYHLTSFIEGCTAMLEKFPDYKNLNTLETIRSKAFVNYFGIDLSEIERYRPLDHQKGKEVVLLWNHRWEYDKNPDMFFKVLFKLKERGIRFKLIVLGESFTKAPSIFKEAQQYLEEEIIHWGYCESKEMYYQKLYQSDILLVTNQQDFFGISILEAMSCGVFPLLPKRLSYPEFFPDALHPTFFYEDNLSDMDLLKMLTDRVQRLIFDIKYPRGMDIKKWVTPFDWGIRIAIWDAWFIKIVEAPSNDN